MSRTYSLVLLLAVLLVGCNTATYVPEAHLKRNIEAPSLDPTWKLVEDPRYGFTVALPPLWRTSDVSFVASSGPSSSNNPMRGLLLGRSDSGPKYDEFGFMAGTEDTSADAPMMTITRTAMKSNVSLDKESECLADQYRENPMLDGPVDIKKLDLPVGPAKVVSYTISMKFGDQSFNMKDEVYLLADGKDLYKASFFTVSDKVSAFPTEPIMKTLRIVAVK